MKGITGGFFGPTGPVQLMPTGPTGISGIAATPRRIYEAIYLKTVTGTAYIAGTSGGCSTGAGFPLSVGDAAFRLPYDNIRQLHVLAPAGTMVRWLAL